jgi:bleomycin hydrolase
MSKKDRVLSGESQMTHAMVFSGLNRDANGKIDRWEVENSWGPPKNGSSSYVMTDDWFTEHMFEIVVHKSLLDQETLDAWNSTKAPLVLPIWDPMGSLA